ncbi:ATP-binding protein [Chloroflexi bacterium TSY]|nr:ATP-binding protein [Chloroflexi bacterium TSY]
METFVDRHKELYELNELGSTRTSQFITVYGRRRVGKTTLLLHWVQQTGRPYIYWMARRGETAESARQHLVTLIWQWAYPDEQDPDPPQFGTWSQLFNQMVRMIGDQPLILIFDEFPYAVESDPSLPSHVQAAWDHLIKDKSIMLLLSGSHIGMMVDLLNAQAPLYGRTTAQLPVDPLPFGALTDFFPNYGADERIATYAVLGGIPAYLERFDSSENLSANIRRHLFRRAGMFRSEPTVLISDLVREPRTYEAIIRAIAGGHHVPNAIATSTGIAAANLSPYLRRLRKLGLVERRIPATIPRPERNSTTRSRYHLCDSYLRFYFRFIEPNLEMIEQGLVDLLWQRMGEQFRAFVGATVFEELCREWTLIQARQGKLPLQPELVGSHWARNAQVDVLAINWRERAILLGECKWGSEAVGFPVIRKLVEQASKVVPGDDWNVSYAFFARAGFTAPAREEAERVGALLVDLATLDRDLRQDMIGDIF